MGQQKGERKKVYLPRYDKYRRISARLRREYYSATPEEKPEVYRRWMAAREAQKNAIIYVSEEREAGTHAIG